MTDNRVHPQLFPVIVAKALDNAFRAAEEVELTYSGLDIRVHAIATDPSKAYSLPDIEFSILWKDGANRTGRTEAYACLDETANSMKGAILGAIETLHREILARIEAGK